jgi:mannose-6-phosphate isomerase-like protein (cupin superfamily)
LQTASKCARLVGATIGPMLTGTWAATAASSGDWREAVVHLHHTEDQVFPILEGEMRFKVADQEFRAGAGEIFLAPKGIPHTYQMESAQGARWLTITTGQDFERFVRAIAKPSESEGLPAPSGSSTLEQQEALAEVFLRYGIELISPALT